MCVHHIMQMMTIHAYVMRKRKEMYIVYRFTNNFCIRFAISNIKIICLYEMEEHVQIVKLLLRPCQSRRFNNRFVLFQIIYYKRHHRLLKYIYILLLLKYTCIQYTLIDNS